MHTYTHLVFRIDILTKKINHEFTNHMILSRHPLCLPGRKADGTTEPAFYHSGPYSLDEEMVLGHAIGAINDLTPGILIAIISLTCIPWHFGGKNLVL